MRLRLSSLRLQVGKFCFEHSGHPGFVLDVWPGTIQQQANVGTSSAKSKCIGAAEGASGKDSLVRSSDHAVLSGVRMGTERQRDREAERSLSKLAVWLLITRRLEEITIWQ